MNFQSYIRPTARMMLCLCASLLCAAVVISALPTAGEEAIYDRVIRLHVLANSDTEEDQTLKLRVRNEILTALADVSENAKDADDAETVYTSCLPMLESIARQTVTDAGYDYDCRVTLTREAYPVRTYDDGNTCYTLPAGTYRSLRVMIGEAAGANWWCVLFPPLCLSLAAEKTYPEGDAIPVSVDESERADTSYEQLLAVGFTPYEISLISGEGSPKTVVKFRIVEWFRKLFAK